MNYNPWQVHSIQDFYCLKCPECTFFSKEEHDFKDHAVENHPMSFSLFGKSEENIDMTISEHYIESPNDKSYPKQSTSETACVYIKEEYIENDIEVHNSKSEKDIHNINKSAEHETINNEDYIDTNYFEPAITIKEEIGETLYADNSQLLPQEDKLKDQKCVKSD